MRMMCFWRDRQTFITGYCPDAKGMPQAIIVWKGGLKAVKLNQIRFDPKKLRKRRKFLTNRELDLIADGVMN